jgi:hypothetical protein
MRNCRPPVSCGRPYHILRTFLVVAAMESFFRMLRACENNKCFLGIRSHLFNINKRTLINLRCDETALYSNLCIDISLYIDSICQRADPVLFEGTMVIVCTNHTVYPIHINTVLKLQSEIAH